MDYYLGNAKILKEGIESCGFKSYGGVDSPYVYVDLAGRPSWEVFEELLEKAQVRSTAVHHAVTCPSMHDTRNR